MDIEKLARILPQPASAGGKPTEVSLFDAVRKWTDAEGVDAFEIELDGKRLTSEEIQTIAHSEDYKGRLYAFNERLG